MNKWLWQGLIYAPFWCRVNRNSIEPIWNFASASNCSHSSAGSVWARSRDRVGRYFHSLTLYLARIHNSITSDWCFYFSYSKLESFLCTALFIWLSHATLIRCCFLGKWTFWHMLSGRLVTTVASSVLLSGHLLSISNARGLDLCLMWGVSRWRPSTYFGEGLSDSFPGVSLVLVGL